MDHQLPENETLSVIERLIREMPEQSQVFLITPRIAQYLLDKYNTGNRSKKPSRSGIGPSCG